MGVISGFSSFSTLGSASGTGDLDTVGVGDNGLGGVEGFEMIGFFWRCGGGDDVPPAGIGDIGGDFRRSGFGIGAGFSAVGTPTMCFGLKGLNLRTIFCFELGASCFPFLFSTTTGLLFVPLRRPIILACFVGLNPLTFGANPPGRLGVALISPLSLLIGMILSAEFGVFSELLLLIPFAIWFNFLGLFSITLIGTTRSLVGVASLLDGVEPLTSGSPSRLMGIILSCFGPSSSGIAILQLLCFNCSRNSGLNSLNTAGTFSGLNSSGLLSEVLVSISLRVEWSFIFDIPNRLAKNPPDSFLSDFKESRFSKSCPLELSGVEPFLSGESLGSGLVIRT